MKRNSASNPRQPAGPPASWEDPIIEFKITLPQAQTVAVVGTFNGWDPSRMPLRNEGGGVWRVLVQLNPGRYEYRYVVDGQWQEDPAAKEFAPNPFGGRNSVVTVASESRHPGPAAVAA